MTTAPKPRRFGRFVLVASLALNVLLIGAIVGSVASGRAGPGRGFDLQIGPLGQVLTKEQRNEVGRDLRRAIRDAGIDRPDRRAVVANVAALLEAEAFDQTAFETAITGQYARLDQVRDVALQTFSAYLSDLPVADRRALAETLVAQSQRGGPKWSDRNGAKDRDGNGSGGD